MNGIVDKILSIRQKEGFSEYEADFPVLRSDWWTTRSHRTPADFFPNQWRRFINSMEEFERVLQADALADIVEAIRQFREAGASASLGDLGRVDKARWLAQRVVTRTGGHSNFRRALDNLERLIKRTPQWKARFGDAPELDATIQRAYDE